MVFIVGTYALSLPSETVACPVFTYYYIRKRRLLSGLRSRNANILSLSDRLPQCGCFARDGGRRCGFRTCPIVRQRKTRSSTKALSLPPESLPRGGGMFLLWYFIVCTIIYLACPVFWSRAYLIRLFVFNILKCSALRILFGCVVWSV